jgi:hypothetical protein
MFMSGAREAMRLEGWWRATRLACGTVLEKPQYKERPKDSRGDGILIETNMVPMKIAALTMCYNEAFFLPIWLEHYGCAFGFEHLYIVDDSSTDGCMSDVRAKNILRKKRSPLDEIDRALLISSLHRELLRYYDVVLYSDADEIIVIDPRLEISLRDYLCREAFDYKNVIGFNVLHDYKHENSIYLDEDLFAQRAYVKFDHAYCKQLISKVPIRWNAGFHNSNRKPQYDTNLLLFHLRGIDLEYSRSRIKILNKIDYSYSSLKHNHAWQWRASEDDYLNFVFDTSDSEFADALQHDLADAMNTSTVIRIPSRFRNSVKLSKLKCSDATNAVKYTGNILTEEKFSKCLKKSRRQRIVLHLEGALRKIAWPLFRKTSFGEFLKDLWRAQV